MKKFILTLGIFALTAVCANAQNKPLLSLNDMPHTAKGMRVELTKDGMMAMEARIMKNGCLVTVDNLIRLKKEDPEALAAVLAGLKVWQGQKEAGQHYQVEERGNNE